MPDPTPPPAGPDRGQVRVQASVLEVRRYPDGLYALVRLVVVDPARAMTICAQESTIKVGHPGDGQVIVFEPIPLFVFDFLEGVDSFDCENAMEPPKQPDPGF